MHAEGNQGVPLAKFFPQGVTLQVIPSTPSQRMHSCPVAWPFHCTVLGSRIVNREDQDFNVDMLRM
jgi:hypothetical protein